MDPVIDDDEDEDLDTNLDGLDHLDDKTAKTEKPAAEGSSKVPTKQPAEWEAAIAELATTVKTATEAKAEPKRPPTQEEINQYWGVWDPTKENPRFIEEFFNLPEDADAKTVEAAKKRFVALQTNLVKQALVGAERRMEQHLAKIEERLAPVQEYISSAQARETRKTFFKQFPALAVENEDGEPRYGKILSLAANELADQEFPNKKAYFKALAERAAEVLKGAGVPLDLSAVKTKTQGTPRLPRTSVGGSGGAGGMTGVFQALAAKGDATDEFLEDD